MRWWWRHRRHRGAEARAGAEGGDAAAVLHSDPGLGDDLRAEPGRQLLKLLHDDDEAAERGMIARNAVALGDLDEHLSETDEADLNPAEPRTLMSGSLVAASMASAVRSSEVVATVISSSLIAPISLSGAGRQALALLRSAGRRCR